MKRFLWFLLLASVGFVPAAGAQSQPTQTVGDTPVVDATLPAPPHGKSTVIGGEIRQIDVVLDEITLKAYGEKAFKIFFDARTEVYRDGKRISVLDLRPADHASVQTVLDGTKIFALSMHILSKSPEGDFQGRVLSFNAATGELNMSGVLSKQPIKLHVTPSTAITRQGQSSFASASGGQSDLVSGALVSVKFESDKEGRGVVTQIGVLATPGATFVFSGNISAFDMHDGLLVIVDPRDDKSYSITFNPASFPVSQHFSVGQSLRVTANFDGTRYVANEITVNQASQ
jgi:hypothetical protein